MGRRTFHCVYTCLNWAHPLHSASAVGNWWPGCLTGASARQARGDLVPWFPAWHSHIAVLFVLKFLYWMYMYYFFFTILIFPSISIFSITLQLSQIRNVFSQRCDAEGLAVFPFTTVFIMSQQNPWRNGKIMYRSLVYLTKTYHGISALH